MDVHALLPLTMTTLGGFLVAALVIAVTPGPDTALTLRNTLIHGSGAGLATAWGSAAGMFAHTFAVVFGVAALLAVSVTAFTVFKVVGALYLFWLGILAFREAFRKHVTRPLDSEATEATKHAEIAPSAPAPFVTMLQRWGPARLGASPFAQGLVSAITNPKMAVFMLTFLPQYLDPTGFVIVQAVLLT
ncbi:MAG: LysE family translocator, partial [Proteobacteria bacterium]|nr:LysE family translocator [Pseudomonadota bacterium]